MNIQLSLLNAFQALCYNGKRSMLTMLGIIIGVGSVIIILSLGRGFERYTVENLTQSNTKNVTVDMSFFPNDSTAEIEYFSDQDLSLVESLKGVGKVEFIDNSTDTLYKDLTLNDAKYNKSIFLVKTQGRPVNYGRTIEKSDGILNHKVAVVDSDIAKLLGEGSVETAIGKGIEIDSTIYQIVGIIQSNAEDLYSDITNIEIPKETYDFYNPVKSQVSNIRIHISEGHKPSTIGNRAVKLLSESGSQSSQGTYETFDMGQLTDGIGKILSVFTIFISGIAGISLLIAGVGVMNMMYTSVSERTQEIGVRRAVGARQKDIRNQFLIEGLLLTISSGVIGYAIGFLFAYIISLALPFNVQPDLFTVSLAIGITGILGLTFSIAPANSAAKKDLVTLLR